MIYYEKHPVSEKRKSELRAKGYRVRDIRFAPKGWQDPEAPKPEAKKAKRKVIREPEQN